MIKIRKQADYSTSTLSYTARGDCACSSLVWSDQRPVQGVTSVLYLFNLKSDTSMSPVHRANYTRSAERSCRALIFNQMPVPRVYVHHLVLFKPHLHDCCPHISTTTETGALTFHLQWCMYRNAPMCNC